MSVHKHGFWENMTDADIQKEHCFDLNLCNSIINFLKNEGASKVVDFGCGTGQYVEKFIARGINTDGFDGNPDTPRITKGLGKVLDFTNPIVFEQPYDWVMSLEVGEHIPAEFEDVFINNLHKNNKNGIILSWAVKGQGGLGHVNCQNNDYVKSKICGLGYVCDEAAENVMRAHSSLSWFKNTIMVFRRK